MAGFLGASLQVIGGIVESVDRVGPTEPGFAFRTSVIAVAYLMLLVAVIGLSRSGAAGGGLPARIGLAAVGVGFAGFAVAQVVLRIDFLLAEQVLFPAATVLIGLGMIVAGIGVLRARRWRGPLRAIPLICGLYPFLVIFPAFAIGGPNFLVLSGFGACWAALAVGLWLSASTRAGGKTGAPLRMEQSS
ncbi:MAG: hypothetical protein ACRDT4_27605 [Micromonosporaceae bacterium]